MASRIGSSALLLAVLLAGLFDEFILDRIRFLADFHPLLVEARNR